MVLSIIHKSSKCLRTRIPLNRVFKCFTSNVPEVSPRSDEFQSLKKFKSHPNANLYLLSVNPDADPSLLNLNKILDELKPLFIVTDCYDRKIKKRLFGDLSYTKKCFLFWYYAYAYREHGYIKAFQSSNIQPRNLCVGLDDKYTIHNIGPDGRDIFKWLFDDFLYKYTYTYRQSYMVNDILKSTVRNHPGLDWSYPIEFLSRPMRTGPYSPVYDYIRIHPYYMEKLRQYIVEAFLPKLNQLCLDVGSNTPEKPNILIVSKKLFSVALAEEWDRRN